MKNLTFILVLIPTITLAQLYAPIPVSESQNNRVGIGINNPGADLHILSGANHGSLILEGTEQLNLIPTPFLIKGLFKGQTSFEISPTGTAAFGYNPSTLNTPSKVNIHNSLSLVETNDHLLTLDYASRLRGASIIWKSTNGPNDEENLNFRYLNNTAKPILSLSPAGAVGVGTSAFSPNHLFYVGGKILCEEVTVMLQSDWPDYVFNSDYQRMPLKELEEFIGENKRLPGVPSAEEVAENGIEIGEVQAILLEKIEELTLEIIELEKRLTEMEADDNAPKESRPSTP